MSATTSFKYDDMMLPEAIRMEGRLHDQIDEFDSFPIGTVADWEIALVQTLLIEVQDRIAHLTSLLTF